MPQYNAVIDLSALTGSTGAEPGFVINGIDPFDNSGISVASAGDVNGDGLDDILIGAPFADPGGDSYAGESYVVFGKAGGFGASLDLASLDGTNGFRLDGIDARDVSGRSVASAGDVNGDGFDDILIGANGADPGGDSAAGETYVVFGKAGGFGASLDLASLDGTNGFRLDGIEIGDFSGFYVASAGDVNGDGFDDILIGAYRGDPGGDTDAGESYVVFGKGGGFGASLDLASLDGTNGFRLDGIGASDYSGFSVASAGDVNGDGFDDILIGATGANSYAGESYVVFGKAGGFAASLDLASLDGTNGFRLDGIDAVDVSGFSVASAGDVNGDGFDDILIGARNGDPGGNSDAGESYVVLGRKPDSAVTRLGTEAGQTLAGGDFNDVLRGFGGDDELFGNGGNDLLGGGLGNDILRGGAGNDIYVLDGGFDTIIETSGNDTITSTISRSLMDYSGVENLTLVRFANINATGDNADNVLTGNSGRNTLDGMGGNDVLAGRGGADILIGGSGRDRFDFDFTWESRPGNARRDTIDDFRRGVDDIDLRGIDADNQKAGNQSFRFVGEDGFSRTAGELRFFQQGGDTIVEADINGDGKVDFQIELEGLFNLTRGDFLL
jgi:hypothetical protein